MAKYGVKVGQRGVDVGRAADFQLALSTDWPLLKVHKTGRINAPAFTPQLIVENDLGRLVPFMIFTDGSDSITQPDGSSSRALSTAFFLNEKGLYAHDNFNSINGYYIIFDYDLDQEFISEVDKSVVQPSSNEAEYGVKIPLKGKSMESRDMRDYILHPGMRPMAIHMAGQRTTTAAAPFFDLEHNLGYPPAYLVFEKKQGSPFVANTGNQPYLQVFANRVTAETSNSLRFSGVQALMIGTFYFLLLKDPLIAEDS